MAKGSSTIETDVLAERLANYMKSTEQRLEDFVRASKESHEAHDRKLNDILYQVQQTNGKVKSNTAFREQYGEDVKRNVVFRTRVEGLLMIAKWVGFTNMVAVIWLIIKVFGQ